jgi:hypothetical protein
MSVYRQVGKEVAEQAGKAVKKNPNLSKERIARRIAEGKNVRTKHTKGKASEMQYAARQDDLRPVKDFLSQRGYNWSRFSGERLSVDPSLGRLGPAERQKRIIALWNELGPEEFGRRFNV